MYVIVHPGLGTKARGHARKGPLNIRRCMSHDVGCLWRKVMFKDVCPRQWTIEPGMLGGGDLIGSVNFWIFHDFFFLIFLRIWLVISYMMTRFGNKGWIGNRREVKYFRTWKKMWRQKNWTLKIWKLKIYVFDICFRTFNYYRYHISFDFVKKYIKKYIIVF